METTTASRPLAEATLRTLSPPIVRRVSAHVDEPDPAVGKALTAAVTGTLGLVASHTTDRDLARRVFAMATEENFLAAKASGLAPLVDAVLHDGTAISGMAGRLRSVLYGDRASAVAHALARASGVALVSAVSLLDVSAAITLWILNEEIEEGALDAQAFARRLDDQALALRTPEWLLAALGPAHRMGTARAPLVASDVALGDQGRPVRWWPYALLGAAAFGIIVALALLEGAHRAG